MKTPKSWADVKISQYYNLCEALEMDWATQEDKAVAMLSALSGISIKQLMEEVPAKTLIKAINDIAFIGEDKTKGNPLPVIWVGKRRFKVDLLIRGSIASSFISHTEYSKSLDIAKVNIHNILAIYFHETNWFGFKKKRTAKRQLEIAEYLKNNLTMDKAFIYSGFFLKSWKALYKAMVSYSELKNREAMKALAKEARSL